MAWRSTRGRALAGGCVPSFLVGMVVLVLYGVVYRLCWFCVVLGCARVVLVFFVLVGDAKEVDVGDPAVGKKAIILMVPFKILKAFHKKFATNNTPTQVSPSRQ